MLKNATNAYKNSFAISGRPLRSIKGFNEFSTTWLTKKQVSHLNLTLKPDAKPVQCALRNDETPFDCYRMEDVMEKKELSRVLQKPQISISSGNPYKPTTLYYLLRASMERKYSSNLWGTREFIEKHGCALKSNEEPVKLEIGDKNVSLYNMDQCADKEKITAVFEQREKAPKSVRTGGEFSGEAREALELAAESSPKFSSFWLTRKQADIMGVAIKSDAEGVRTAVDGQEFEFFNASQTQDEKAVIAAAQKNRVDAARARR